MVHVLNGSRGPTLAIGKKPKVMLTRAVQFETTTNVGSSSVANGNSDVQRSLQNWCLLVQ